MELTRSIVRRAPLLGLAWAVALASAMALGQEPKDIKEPPDKNARPPERQAAKDVRKDEDRARAEKTARPERREDRGAWLGVYLGEAQEGDNGARVSQVYPAGPAARAGLRPGDVIQKVDEQKIGEPGDLITLINEREPRTNVKMSILRNTRPLEINAMLGSRDNFIFNREGYGRDEDYGRDTQRNRRGYSNDQDDSEEIPLYAMELEHNRRMAEQHQRIEQELRELREEVRLLREALTKK